MDKIIFGLLQEEIDYIFKDFKQEDLNTNFFKGDLELQNLELNTDAIQEFLATIVPFIQIEKAIVRKLRVKVPFSAPKAKATEIFISKIDIVAKEPLEYLGSEAQPSPKPTPPKPKTGKFNYSLAERIMDGLKGNFAAQSQVYGVSRLKMQLEAPYDLRTPHLADINIFDFELYSTNEKWQVPAEHADTRAYTHGKEHVWVFKEATCKVSVRLIPFRGTKNTQSVQREPIPLLEKVPIKAQVTLKRFNSDEKLGCETSIFANDTKIELTSKQVGYFAQWVEAVAAAAARSDLKSRNPADIEVPDMPLLINLVCNEVNIVLVEEKPGGIKMDFLTFDLKGLLTNLYSSLETGPGARFTFSNILVKDLKHEKTLMRLYHRDKSAGNYDLPLPNDVLIHPDVQPLPKDPHGAFKVDIKLPVPDPPTPCLNFRVKADSCEIVLDRDSCESLALFITQSLLINRSILTPTASDYKNPQHADLDKAKLTPGLTEVGDEFFDVDLLAGGGILFTVLAESKELRVIFPNPGLEQYLGLLCSEPRVEGSPTAPAIKYNNGLLSLKSDSGVPICQPHDYFWQKFNGTPLVEDRATKISGTALRFAVNYYPNSQAAEEPLAFINKLSANIKLYSMAKDVVQPASNPQIECNISVKDVKATIHQHQYALKEGFRFKSNWNNVQPNLWQQALFSLTSENEVKKLLESNETSQATHLTTASKIMMDPTFMIAILTDSMSVQILDSKKVSILMCTSKGAEAVIERHPGKGLVFGKLEDIRLWAVPELEQSLFWVKKTTLKNVCHSRTEWRNWGKRPPNAPQAGPSTLYVLADIDGINLNLNMASIYHCLDYLVSVLGDSILLLNKTEHSHFFYKVFYYANILLFGLQSDSFDYWMSLREVKEIADQLSDALLDLFWDIKFSNFNLVFGDEKTYIKPFSFKHLQVRSSKPEDDKQTWGLKIEGLQGSIAQLEDAKVTKEEPLSVPFDFIVDYTNAKNPEWTETSPPTVYPRLQNVEIATKPAVSVSVTPEHFRMVAGFVHTHIAALKDTVEKLIQELNKRPNTVALQVTDENALDEMRGYQQKLHSPSSAIGLKKDLDAVSKRLGEQELIQFELMGRNAELQSRNAELENKLAAALKEVASYQTAMGELQSKLIHLQLGSL